PGDDDLRPGALPVGAVGAIRPRHLAAQPGAGLTGLFRRLWRRLPRMALALRRHWRPSARSDPPVCADRLSGTQTHGQPRSPARLASTPREAPRQRERAISLVLARPVETADT